jgi:hypothetical protein
MDFCTQEGIVILHVMTTTDFKQCIFMCVKQASSKKRDGLPINKSHTFRNFVYCNLKDLQDSTRWNNTVMCAKKINVTSP